MRSEKAAGDRVLLFIERKVVVWVGEGRKGSSVTGLYGLEVSGVWVFMNGNAVIGGGGSRY